ncbi:hypothetical protein [Streptomyces sp. NPDC057686]|uniref:hypothetical protein n=1 Tax=Streptomyces sp. NPDC057686 TaxID=3346212 RepID=UPI00369F0B26
MAVIAPSSLSVEAAMRNPGGSVKKIGSSLAVLALPLIGVTPAQGVQSTGNCPDDAVCVYNSIISTQSTMTHIFRGEPPLRFWSVTPRHYGFSVVNQKDKAIQVHVDEKGKEVSLATYCVTPQSSFSSMFDSARMISVMGGDTCLPKTPKIPLP